MFGFLKSGEERRKAHAEKQRQQAAYAEGQKAGAAMTEAIDAFLDPRLAQLQVNLLNVFKQRLLTIKDEPNHTPQIVARVELKIFLENVEKFEERMQQETIEAAAEWYKLAGTLDLTNLFQDYVWHKAQEAKLHLIVQATELAGVAIIEADPSSA